MGKTVINAIQFDDLTADPSPLNDGMVWFRSDLDEIRKRINGVTVTIESSSWQPPAINIADGLFIGVSVFRSSGAGLLFTFDAASDDEASFNIPLKNNGIDYDGSDLKIVLLYQIPANGGGGDTVKLDVDYALIGVGDNADSEVTQFTDELDVSAILATTTTEHETTTLTGEINAKVLQLSIERNSTGVGADTYGNDFDLIGIEIKKV